jgi:hypothetical protein
MSQLRQLLHGERPIKRIAGFFDTRREALLAVQELLDSPEIDMQQVSVLSPTPGGQLGEPALERAVALEDHTQQLAAVRTHLLGGALGLTAGLLLYAWLFARSNPALLASPGVALLLLCGFGITFGLLAAGAVALRPDQDRVIARVRRALNDGQWAVVVHPQDSRQTRQALLSLKHHSPTVIRSL